MGEQKKGVVLQVQQTFLRLAGSSISNRIYILIFFLTDGNRLSYRRQCGLWAIITNIYVFTI